MRNLIRHSHRLKVVLPVQFSNLFIEDLRKLANMAA